MIKITNVEIKNFRNIKSASFDLNNRCAIEGQNALGKTNILEAICFALTNYLLDGSSDLKSIKPKDDMSAKVSVKLTFSNDKTFEKVYYETWTKTRGTDEVKLTGHTTEYYVNDAKVSSVATAQRQLLEDILGINYSPKTSKIDVLQMQLNPLWLFKYIDWQLLRKYIIELVGDVSNEEVIDKVIQKQGNIGMVNSVKTDLVRNNYKTDIVLNLYKSGMNTAKQQVAIYENSIDEDSKISDVDEAAFCDALSKKDSLLILKQKLIDSKKTAINPLVAEFEKELSQLKEKYNNQKSLDFENYKKSTSEITLKINESQERFNNVSMAYDSHLKIATDKGNELLNKQNSQTMIEREIQNLYENVSGLRLKYDQVYNRTFTEKLNLPEEIHCPHCGGVVNESYIEEVKTNYNDRKNNFEASINSELNEITKKAEEINLKIDSKNYELEELNTEIQKIIKEHTDLMNIASNYEKDKLNAFNNLKNLQQQMPTYNDSEETLSLKLKIVEMESQLNNEKTRVITTPEIDEKINEINVQLDEIEKVIDKRKFYVGIQLKINETKSKLNVEENKLIEFEAKTMMVEEFIKTKLSMLNSNIATVFDDVKFVLVSSNIKDGSWNQECYPLIIGTQTPFEHGSRSEQYVTAIKIVEKIKKLVGLPNIPYLIDEAGTFDSNTITNKLVTNSQIIASRMNDKYKVITVNEL